MSYQMKAEKRTNSGGPYVWRSFAPGCDEKTCDELDELDEYSCCHYIKNKNNPGFNCTGSSTPCRRMDDVLKNPKNIDKFGSKMTTNHYWFTEQFQMSPDFGLVKEFEVNLTLENDGWEELAH